MARPHLGRSRGRRRPAPTKALPAPTPSPSARKGQSTCTTSQLKITLGPSNGAAGSTNTSLVFQNRSARECDLDGHPGVSFVAGPDGRQTGHPAARRGTPQVVVLQPGERAHAELRVVSYQAFRRGECRPTATRGFRVYPPDQTAATFVPAVRTACANPNPLLNLLTVGPVVAGGPTP